MKDRCFLFQQPINVAVIYVHVPDEPNHAAWAYNLVTSWQKHCPQYPFKFVVASAHKPPSDQMMGMLRLIDQPNIFLHDDAGWDIGAYQAYCRESQDDMLVFLGGSSYIRRAGWLARMVESFAENKGIGLFGACGNTGDTRFNVYPHIRTTGFWCSPQLMNSYPMRVVDPSQRYPFEHGSMGLTSWARSNGFPVKVVDFSSQYDFPHWNDGPNGYHKGDQRDLIVGDRLTAPPYYEHP